MGNAHSTHDAPVVMVSEKPASYPTSIRSTKNNKKPQPFFNESFLARHTSPEAIAAQQQLKRMAVNKPAGHVNFFEVASMTAQPTKNKSSSHTNSSSSSVKTASTHTNQNQSYPSTINTHSQRAAKRLNSTASSLSSSRNGSQTSSTTSITAVDKPVQPQQPEDPDYVVLHGRKYWKGHGSQTFILPCDDDENDRLMTMHYILKSALHGNFISPIEDLLHSETKQTKVLDIGCGSGTWILEMATEFPNTEFYGVDDCPLFPTSIKPANSHFKLHNVLTGLPFKDNEFDFVYMRLMVLYFTPEELAHLLKEISRIMKPGGYLEVVDTNYNIRSPGPISHKVVNSEIKSLLHRSDDVLASNYESNTNHPIFTFLMLAPQHSNGSFVANFVDICQEHTTLPLGGWGGGQIGNLHGENFKKLLSSIQYKLPSNSLDETLDKVLTLEGEKPCLPLPKSTIHTILDECEQHKSYLDWFACYARKPLDDDQLEQSTLDSIYEFVEGFVDV